MKERDLIQELLYNFDEELSSLLTLGCKGEVWIAGGAITSVFTNSEINDYDLYFQKKSDIEFIMPYLLDHSTIVFVSNKAITFNISGQIYQIIHYSEFEHAGKIFNDFDFSINQASYGFKANEFELSHSFLYTLKVREPYFNSNTKYPILSAMRMNKYERKGYRFNNLTKMRIYGTIANLKLNTIEEFCDQISGYYGRNIDMVAFKNAYKDKTYMSWLMNFHRYLRKDTLVLDTKTNLLIEDENWSHPSKYKKIKEITGLDFETDYNKKPDYEEFMYPVCISCGKDICNDGFKDRLSAIEFGISGLCQLCQDVVFNENKTK